MKAPTAGESEGENKIVGQTLGWILLPIFLAAGVLQCVIIFYIGRWMILALWQHPHELRVLGAIGIVVLLLLVFPRSEPNSDYRVEDKNLTRGKQRNAPALPQTQPEQG